MIMSNIGCLMLISRNDRNILKQPNKSFQFQKATGIFSFDKFSSLNIYFEMECIKKTCSIVNILQSLSKRYLSE